MTASRAVRLSWADVSYRLTQGWLVNEDGNAELTLERFEVGGHAKVGGPCARYGEKVDFVVTIFFGDAPSVLPSASRADLVTVTGPVEPRLLQDTAYLTVNGSDFPLDNIRYPATGHGYGPKFGDGDLAELSRRSGISKNKLQEAFGTIKQYRLEDGLLQPSTFMRPTGRHEVLTVIPEGDWRAVEYGGAIRILSLRRHVIHTFHLTPMGVGGIDCIKMCRITFVIVSSVEVSTAAR